MMNKITTLVYWAIIGCMFACSTVKNKQPGPYRNFQLPGTIFVDTNFYCDQTEITNFSWLEYFFWQFHTFGENSQEYKMSFPNDSVWLKEDSCLHKYLGNYFRHPAYSDYPVVGITQEQAKAYSKWRSDRVFQFLLIKNGVLDWNMDDSTNYFTIEKYFNGEYQGHTPDPRFQYYPVYRLPSVDEQYKMSEYMERIYNTLDSLRENDTKHNKYYNCLYRSGLFFNSRVAIQPCPNDSVFHDPTAPVANYPKYCEKFSMLYHIDGNVAELTSEENTLFIDSWKKDYLREKLKHKKEHGEFKMEFPPEFPSTWVGFRCVAEWKKWGE